ncbi:MAG TPA: DUF4292 domain-containing protein [Daejeonella sp.]|nr:DUF4292 domain-containing protein [Daejeonella sp.]
MRRNILNSLLLVVLAFALHSCKAKKQIIKTSSAAPVASTSEARLASIANNSLNYTSLSIKAKADLSINENDNNVSMNIRIRKGEAIWVSVTAIAGLEVARALITPDSIKVLNWLESTYIKKPFNYIYNFTNNQVDFNTIEEIFAGNPLRQALSGQSDFNLDGSHAILEGTLKSLAYSIRFNEQDKVIQSSLTDEAAAQNLRVHYDDFVELEQQLIPRQVNIESVGERKNIVINLKYSRIELNHTLEMPFKVSKKFTVKD